MILRNSVSVKISSTYIVTCDMRLGGFRWGSGQVHVLTHMGLGGLVGGPDVIWRLFTHISTSTKHGPAPSTQWTHMYTGYPPYGGNSQCPPTWSTRSKCDPIARTHHKLHTCTPPHTHMYPPTHVPCMCTSSHAKKRRHILN